MLEGWFGSCEFVCMSRFPLCVPVWWCSVLEAEICGSLAWLTLRERQEQGSDDKPPSSRLCAHIISKCDNLLQQEHHPHDDAIPYRIFEDFSLHCSRKSAAGAARHLALLLISIELDENEPICIIAAPCFLHFVSNLAAESASSTSTVLLCFSSAHETLHRTIIHKIHVLVGLSYMEELSLYQKCFFVVHIDCLILDYLMQKENCMT